ncbi:response regulator [Pseudoduganella namucuonensis]|nr:response regulator transcription factor [Pseudoduganella namucuonensis]
MKILLLDDHTLFREGIALLLKRLHSEVCTIMAGSCEEALDLLKNDAGINLMLIDLCLPGMSGLDGMSVLREKYPNIPFVALSSNCDRETALLALGRGAMGFIPKNSAVDTMIAALRLILAKGIYLPPSVFLDEQYPQIAHTSHKVLGANTDPKELGLTPRQIDVLYWILQGISLKNISRELNISVNTVKAHTSVVLRTLNVTTRTQAIIVASRLGLKFA